MLDETFRFNDKDGDTLIVEKSSEPGTAYVTTASAGVYLTVAKIPAFCRAVYEAAGLEAPELPDLVDTAMAAKLAEAFTRYAVTGFSAYDTARKLVADGWTLSVA